MVKLICKYGHDKSIVGTYRQGHCRACRQGKEYLQKVYDWKKKNPERTKAINKKYYLKVRDTKSGYHAMYNLKAALNRYNLSIEDYNKALELQNNMCKICLKQARSIKRLAIDHDHTTGKFRGLLCDNCNRALGYIHDNKTILQNMIQYLENNE